MKLRIYKISIFATILLIPFYLLRFRFLNIPTNALDICMLLVFLQLLFIKKTALAKISKKNNLLLYLIFFLLLGAFLSLFGKNFSLSGLGILKSWFILPLLFAFSIITIVETKQDFINVILALFLSTFGASTISLIYACLEKFTYDYRLSAYYESPNYLAMFVVPGILCGIYLAKENSNKIYVYAIYAAIFIELLALYLTKSYANWLGLLFTAVITSIFFFGRKKYILIIFLGMSLLSFLFFSQFSTPKFNDIIINNPRSSLASRIMIWKASYLMIKNNPLRGIGAGNFQTNYLSLQPNFPPYLEWAVPQPHNIFLAFWLQTGLIGFLSFVGILIANSYSLLKISLCHKKNATAIFLLAFFFYMICIGLVDTPYWKNDLSFIFWLFVALSAAAKNIEFDILQPRNSKT